MYSTSVTPYSLAGRWKSEQDFFIQHLFSISKVFIEHVYKTVELLLIISLKARRTNKTLFYLAFHTTSHYNFRANDIQPRRYSVQFHSLLLQLMCHDAATKKSPLISSIVQIIFSFWSFEISKSILRKQKLMIGLDSFTKHSLNVWPQYEFKPVFDLSVLLKSAKLQHFSLVFL